MFQIIVNKSRENKNAKTFCAFVRYVNNSNVPPSLPPSKKKLKIHRCFTSRTMSRVIFANRSYNFINSFIDRFPPFGHYVRRRNRYDKRVTDRSYSWIFSKRQFFLFMNFRPWPRRRLRLVSASDRGNINEYRSSKKIKNKIQNRRRHFLAAQSH